MSKVRVAIIGYGDVGVIHAETVRASRWAEVAYTCCLTKSKNEAAAAALGAKAAESVDALFEAGDFDAVIISTPTPAHEEHVTKALRAGKAVFCEKPLAMDFEGTERVLAVAEETGSLLFVGFQRRFDRNFAALKAQLQAGAVGDRIEMLKLTSRDPINPGGGEPAEGRIWNSAIHDLDMACWLTGETPESVYCTQTSIHNLAAVLKFPSGVLCTVDWCNTIRYGYDQRAEVHGPAGMIQVHNPAVSSVTVNRFQGKSADKGYGFFSDRYAEAFATEINAFIECIRTGTPCPVSIDSLRRTAVAANMCTQSLATAKNEAVKEAVPKLTERPASKASNRPDGNVLGICLVGGGRMGSIRAGKFAKDPRTKLLWVMDVDGGRAEALAAEHGAKSTTNLADALADPDVTGVWISVGTAYHMDVIRQVAPTGKHMYCEKPISLECAEVEEAFDLAAKHGVVLSCGWNRRYDPHFEAADAVLRDGSMGKPVTLVVHNGDHPLPPKDILKDLGSIYHDFMVHDIDTAVWMLGEFPVSVYATGTTFYEDLRAEGVIDSACFVMTYASGAIAIATARRSSAHGYDQRVEAVTSEGQFIEVDNIHLNSVATNKGGAAAKGKINYSFPDRYSDAYQAEVAHFAEIVLDGVTPRSNYRQCKEVALLCDAALKSSDEGKAVIFE